VLNPEFEILVLSERERDRDRERMVRTGDQNAKPSSQPHFVLKLLNNLGGKADVKLCWPLGSKKVGSLIN
jgi:hypothetical protein